MRDYTEMTSKKSIFTVQKMVLTAMFGTISAILMALEFPIPFFPPFLKMDFSELPVIIGGYIMGPIAGFIIILIKVGLNFFINGTTTMGVGELSNLLCSVFYMVPAVLLYNRKKTKENAKRSLFFGTLIVTVYAVFNNLILIFPIYMKLMGLKMKDIIKMGSMVNPLIKDSFTMFAIGIVPFNLIKYSVASIITFVVYKKIKNIIFRY